ncbi:hypothetical protein AVEN_12163-1 [Araneus ventricosus]|uniref:Uncharacterized protein n=1 Tax=Araneus ventricosus TaxID=182803 RepID=A0A4Y2L865_ARAVE|nr:hypothetical protein AVEN_12163-1 [Araneus ventricosus]
MLHKDERTCVVRLSYLSLLAGQGCTRRTPLILISTPVKQLTEQVHVSQGNLYFLRPVYSNNQLFDFCTNVTICLTDRQIVHHNNFRPKVCVICKKKPTTYDLSSLRSEPEGSSQSTFHSLRRTAFVKLRSDLATPKIFSKSPNSRPLVNHNLRQKVLEVFTDEEEKEIKHPH